MIGSLACSVRGVEVRARVRNICGVGVLCCCASVAQWPERQPCKLLAAGSTPARGSISCGWLRIAVSGCA